jgi:hypothetical protein
MTIWMLSFPLATDLDELFCEQLFVRQQHLVFGGWYLVRQPFQRIASHRRIGPRTKNEPDRWILPGKRPVLFRVVAVHVHLPDICVIDLSQLQINDDETSQPTMEK